MLNFVGNGRCSRALHWSAEAACRAEAGYRIDWANITHFYLIFTSLLTVMTVKMALLLISLHHYCIAITYLYDCYKIIVTCCYCNNSAAKNFKFFKKQHYYLVPHVDSSPFKKRGHDTSV